MELAVEQIRSTDYLGDNDQLVLASNSTFFDGCDVGTFGAAKATAVAMANNITHMVCVAPYCLIHCHCG